MDFKQWLENEESEYDPPDEEEMNRIRNIPLRCDQPPHLRGLHFRFRMPFGTTQDFLIKHSSIIGLKAVPGSLNKRCLDLSDAHKCADLYKLLQYVKHNNNLEIRRQLLAYRET